MSKKELWLQENLVEIRNKNLQTPIKLDQATTIMNIEKYLNCLEKSLLHTSNKKLERLFVDKIEALLKL
ncbi:hypothetical protein MG290_01835 [Flavobacterium sp. CBA20B-1]|uniref:hypothetical protein n=1 Tax=unclassified Flavobacterium TaxID=196869 RepID=UPI002225A6E2|nr:MULTISPECIES: hypothetical protein [unclassified Flavobacterium]WCM42436.1 hypothetical protein MG290_01835 [Flavobacterium sp. CBA20B-1]